MMQNLLVQMMNQRVDVWCSGAASLRGEVVKVEDGVLHLKDDNGVCYVAVDKITVVWKARDNHEHRAGFVSGALKQ